MIKRGFNCIHSYCIVYLVPMSNEYDVLKLFLTKTSAFLVLTNRVSKGQPATQQWLPLATWKWSQVARTSKTKSKVVRTSIWSLQETPFLATESRPQVQHQCCHHISKSTQGVKSPWIWYLQIWAFLILLLMCRSLKAEHLFVLTTAQFWPQVLLVNQYKNFKCVEFVVKSYWLSS